MNTVGGLCSFLRRVATLSGPPSPSAAKVLVEEEWVRRRSELAAVCRWAERYVDAPAWASPSELHVPRRRVERALLSLNTFRVAADAPRTVEHLVRLLAQSGDRWGRAATGMAETGVLSPAVLVESLRARLDSADGLLRGCRGDTLHVHNLSHLLCAAARCGAGPAVLPTPLELPRMCQDLPSPAELQSLPPLALATLMVAALQMAGGCRGGLRGGLPIRDRVASTQFSSVGALHAGLIPECAAAVLNQADALARQLEERRASVGSPAAVGSLRGSFPAGAAGQHATPPAGKQARQSLKLVAALLAAAEMCPPPYGAGTSVLVRETPFLVTARRRRPLSRPGKPRSAFALDLFCAEDGLVLTDAEVFQDPADPSAHYVCLGSTPEDVWIGGGGGDDAGLTARLRTSHLYKQLRCEAPTGNRAALAARACRLLRAWAARRPQTMLARDLQHFVDVAGHLARSCSAAHHDDAATTEDALCLAPGEMPDETSAVLAGCLHLASCAPRAEEAAPLPLPVVLWLVELGSAGVVSRDVLSYYLMRVACLEGEEEEVEEEEEDAGVGTEGGGRGSVAIRLNAVLRFLTEPDDSCYLPRGIEGYREARLDV